MLAISEKGKKREKSPSEAVEMSETLTRPVERVSDKLLRRENTKPDTDTKNLRTWVQ